jgi:uncharacterized OsmC-like protein
MQTKEQPRTTEETTFAISLNRERGYQFLVDWAVVGVGDTLVDEPKPLGEGAGPGPSKLLAAAVADCLASSLLFCLTKARIEVQSLEATARGTIRRNEDGHLRIAAIDVILRPAVAEPDLPRMKRCIDKFEDYCTVTGSIRKAIDVSVEVAPVVA